MAHLPIGDARGVVRHCDIDNRFSDVGSECGYCTRIKYEHIISDNSLFHFSSSVRMGSRFVPHGTVGVHVSADH
jgi:hypothetical protein